MLLDPPISAAVSDTPTPSPDQKLLSRGEAARHLGVPVSTVYQWARTGRLPYKVTLGGHLRFSRADLDASMARRSRSHRQTR